MDIGDIGHWVSDSHVSIGMTHPNNQYYIYTHIIICIHIYIVIYIYTCIYTSRGDATEATCGALIPLRWVFSLFFATTKRTVAPWHPWSWPGKDLPCGMACHRSVASRFQHVSKMCTEDSILVFVCFCWN